MSDTIIKVENLGKRYIIRHKQNGSYDTLRDVITDKVKSIGRRIIKFGSHSSKSNRSLQNEELWALKDV